jgi:uncharacterized protein (TIGR03067 family)
MPEPETAPQGQWRDLRPLLDQELNGLPENYRLPILLCDLEGKTIKEAAQQLGWPQGSLAGRLARGRKLLAKRLASRGVVLSAGSLAAVVSQNVASAGVPTALMSSTVKAASLVAAGQASVAGLVPVKVAALMEGVMKAMLITKLKTVTVALLVVAVAVTGGGLLSCSTEAAAQTADEPSSPQIFRVEGTGRAKVKASAPEYRSIFIKTLAVVTAHFEQITYANQYDGRIEASSVAAAGTEMTRQAFVNLSCVDGKYSVTVCVKKFRTTGDKSEVIGRDAELERMILKELSAQPIPKETQKPSLHSERSVYSNLGPVALSTSFDFGQTAPPRPGAGNVPLALDFGFPIARAVKTDLDRLQGIWSVVSPEQGGKPARLKKAVFMVDGKRACWQDSDREMQGGLYLDSTSKPRTYDFVMSERTIEGIYSLDGDTLRLCQGTKRPVGFATAKGGHQVLIVLKRIHGPEVFPYRLADGSRAFPPVIERVKKATPPPQVAPTPKDSNKYDLGPTGSEESPATKTQQQDFPVKAGKGKRLTVQMAGTDFPVKAGEGKRLTVEFEEQKTLQGSWTPVSVEMMGKKYPNENLDILKITFTGDRLVFNHKDNPTETFTYKIDADKKPHRLSLIWSDGPLKGKTTTMTYQIKDDMLRLSNVEARQVAGTLTLKRAEDGKPRKKSDMVDVAAYNSKVYYVINRGEDGVQVYRFTDTGCETVVGAILRVPRLASVATKGRVWLARLSGTVLEVDWRAITQQGKSDTNYLLRSGDRVYVDPEAAKAGP